MKKRITVMMIAMFIMIASPMMTKQANAATPDEVATYAQKFIGVPYKFGGTTPSGFDCSGYIRYVFNNFGVSLPRTSVEQAATGTAVAKSNLQNGDLVFFKNTYKPGISHAGIYIGNGNVISAESGGIEISNINTNPYWAPRYASARRVLNSNTATAAAGTFSDVTGSHPAYKAIEAMNAQGVIKGYSSGKFEPQAQITRAQAAEMINRVLGLKQQQPSQFSDVGSTHQFANSINAMQEAGILQGYSTGKYGVDEKLTKTQLAVIMERAFNISKYSKSTSSYADVASSYWAYNSIMALKSIDPTTVFQSASFGGNANATRAEFATAIYSSLEAR